MGWGESILFPRRPPILKIPSSPKNGDKLRSRDCPRADLILPLLMDRRQVSSLRKYLFCTYLMIEMTALSLSPSIGYGRCSFRREAI